MQVEIHKWPGFCHRLERPSHLALITEAARLVLAIAENGACAAVFIERFVAVERLWGAHEEGETWSNVSFLSQPECGDFWEQAVRVVSGLELQRFFDCLILWP